MTSDNGSEVLITSSSTKEGFSSSSDNVKEELSSSDVSIQEQSLSACVHITKTSPNILNIDDSLSTTLKSSQIERHQEDTSMEKISDESAVSSVCEQFPSICTVNIDDQSDDMLYAPCEDNDLLSTISESCINEESSLSENKISPFHMLRTPSYQKAMVNKEQPAVPVPGILLEDDSPKKEETEVSIDKEVPCDSPIGASPLKLEGPVLLQPSRTSGDNSPGTNISRSVSFNERLLESQRRSLLESCKYSSVDHSKISNESALKSQADDRLLRSTPGRLQTISKHSSGASTPESEYCGSIAGEFPEKRSIKNLTSNLARHLSFGKNKSKKNKEEAPSPPMPTENYNGLLPSEEGVVSYEELLRLFECPGCRTFMVPPLLQCKKGHLICEKCKSSFKATCPVCKQRVTDLTNFMMEQVYQLVRFPCRFGKYGCPEYHSPKQKTDHEHFCVFRPVHCHYESAGCECVLPMREMNTHIAACHFKQQKHI